MHPHRDHRHPRKRALSKRKRSIPDRLALEKFSREFFEKKDPETGETVPADPTKTMKDAFLWATFRFDPAWFRVPYNERASELLNDFVMMLQNAGSTKAPPQEWIPRFLKPNWTFAGPEQPKVGG